MHPPEFYAPGVDPKVEDNSPNEDPDGWTVVRSVRPRWHHCPLCQEKGHGALSCPLRLCGVCTKYGHGEASCPQRRAG